MGLRKSQALPRCASPPTTDPRYVTCRRKSEKSAAAKKRGRIDSVTSRDTVCFDCERVFFFSDVESGKTT